MSSMLDRSSFMDIYMSCVGAYYSLIGFQDRRYDRGVGLRASDKEMDIGICSSADFFDDIACRFAIMIFSIAYRLLEIGLNQALKNSGMRAFVVITLKLYHSPLI